MASCRPPVLGDPRLLYLIVTVLMTGTLHPQIIRSFSTVRKEEYLPVLIWDLAHHFHYRINSTTSNLSTLVCDAGKHRQRSRDVTAIIRWAIRNAFNTYKPWYTAIFGILPTTFLVQQFTFYHCRLAMFAVLFLPDRWKSNSSCLDGRVWAILLWAIQSLTPTLSSYYEYFLPPRHYCLLINSLIYLLRWYDLKPLKIVRLFSIPCFRFIPKLSQLTGGNYGLMARPPIMRGGKVWLNYLVVSSIF